MIKVSNMFGKSLLMVAMMVNVSDAMADCGENTEVTRLSTTLSAAEGVDTESRGRIHWATKEKGEKSRDRLQAKVIIPLPSVIPLAATPEDAQELEVRLVLSREGTAYAHCLLKLHNVGEEREGSREARYVLHLEQKIRHQEVREINHKGGSCDLDLTQEGIQQGIPRPVAGDSIDVDSDLAVFLHGQF